jgi:hypothetical protein
MTDGHPIEPELTVPTPRRVRYRDRGTGCGLWFVRLFILPHTIIGAGALGAALTFTAMYLAVWLFGDEHPAGVVKRSEQRGSKGMHHTIEYEYTVAGRPHAGRVSVNADQYRQIAEGDRFTVRALAAAPEARAWVRLPGQTPLLEVGAAWLVALFWNGVLSVFLWNVYLRPWRMRRLVRWGRPAPGIVRGQTVSTTKGTKLYHLTFEYAAADEAGAAAVFTGKMASTQAAAASARAGDVVTVLYDRRKPGRSLIYKYADFRAG